MQNVDKEAAFEMQLVRWVGVFQNIQQERRLNLLEDAAYKTCLHYLRRPDLAFWDAEYVAYRMHPEWWKHPGFWREFPHDVTVVNRKT